MYNKFIFSTIHKVYYFLIAYTLVCIIFIYGYNQLPHYEEQFKKVVLHLSIEGVDASTDRTIKTIFANEKDIYRSNLFDTQKRTGNEKELQKLKHKNISSVYIVIPKKENLIFLLDGCNGNRGEFGQLFQPVDMNIFRKIQQTKSKEIFIQDGIKDLGFTLVKPIIKNETVVAFLLIDYTQKSLDNFMS
ncbi:MAG: hypothetical protein K0U38_03645, partial [Epsilonproteobacteria bacterium]|nr:hypothetical protein [Campylobacterota bacterium]